MPRSATDATRFTSTIPHASTKSPSFTRNSSLPQKKPGPPGETPYEKVKRLRAAADAARDAQVTGWDKVIVRGRVWADRAHRFTALSLIGLTFICGGVTVYALGDMMIHNRSKRAQWFQEQKAKHESAVFNARMKIQNGTASDDDIDFIMREEVEEARVQEFLRKKAEKKGVFKTVKEWMLGGLKTAYDDENQTPKLWNEKPLADTNTGSAAETIEEKKVVIQSKAKKAFAEERERQRNGGPLDRLGTSVDEVDVPPKSGGWTSFMTKK